LLNFKNYNQRNAIIQKHRGRNVIHKPKSADSELMEKWVDSWFNAEN
jgi:hypothetical protein